MPQMNTKPVRNIHGSHAFQAGPVAAAVAAATAGVAGVGLTSSSAGFQNRISSTSENIATAALTMSTSHGPWKLLIANCMVAKVPPATRQAGHTSIMRRQPTWAATSQNGTISEKIGSWRPTIALS
jgi:hypothetical protein